MENPWNIDGHDRDGIKAKLAGAAGTYPSVTPQVVKSLAWDAAGLIWELERELADARAKNSELNRRCQRAESGVREAAKSKAHGPSLGRSLANASASILLRERDEARAGLRDARMVATRLSGEGVRYRRALRDIAAEECVTKGMGDGSDCGECPPCIAARALGAES